MSGQISDGNWENSRPYDHYERMCEAKIEVSDDPHINFIPARKYNFADKVLVDVVGWRMIWYVKLFKTYPNSEKIMRDMPETVKGIDGFINYSKRNGGDYFTEKLNATKKFFGVNTIEELREIYTQIEKYDYEHADLIKDLRDMSKTVNDRRR